MSGFGEVGHGAIEKVGPIGEKENEKSFILPRASKCRLECQS